MSYHLPYSGPTVQLLLDKAANLTITNTGWIRLSSTQNNPVSLNSLLENGNYVISFWSDGPINDDYFKVTAPINISITDLDDTYKEQIIYNDGVFGWHRRYNKTNQTFTGWSIIQSEYGVLINPDNRNPGGNIPRMINPIIGTNVPLYPKNVMDNFLFAYPLFDKTGEIVFGAIDVYKEAENKWVNLEPENMMKISIYDPTGVRKNFFTYIDDAVASSNIDKQVADFNAHTGDSAIHTTSAEMSKWSNGATKAQLDSGIEALHTELSNSITNSGSTTQTEVNETLSAIRAMTDDVNAHIGNTTIHPNIEQQNIWSREKSDPDHMHILDGTVNITADKIVSGMIYMDRIDKRALERCYRVKNDEERLALTSAEVHNGDSVYVDSETPEVWFVLDETKLDQHDPISTEQKMSDTIRNWISVCYGNGKYVAITYADNIFAYSTDAINWTEVSVNSTNNYWVSVCYGNGKFIAVCDRPNGAFMYSTDGITWTDGTISNKTWDTIGYGNGKFIVMASDQFAYSTDGINWTEDNMPNNRTWCAIGYGNGKFIAAAGGSTIFAYSTDAINWTEVTVNENNQWWQSICYGNGKYIAVPTDSTSLFVYSMDGINWVEDIISAIYRNWCSVCYGNGKFVVIAADSSAFAYSSDGITWTEGVIDSGNTKWRSVCYGNGKFVAVSRNTNTSAIITFPYLEAMIKYSTIYSEITWDNIEGKPTTLAGYGIVDAYSLPQATNIVNDVATSFNRLTTKTNALPEQLEGIEPIFLYDGTTDYDTSILANVNNEVFTASAAVDEMLRILGRDNDGLSEVKKTVGELITYAKFTKNADWWDICYGNGKFIAIAGGSYSTTNVYNYSADGINWVEGNMPSSRGWRSVCYGNGKFVAIASDRFAYSTDGITWTEGVKTLGCCCYGNGKFVAISGAKYNYSTDGITWIEGNMPSNKGYGSICYGNGKYVATLNINNFAYSTDGITWTEGTITGSVQYYWNSICYGNGKFVVIDTSSDAFAYSTDGINWTQKNKDDIGDSWSSLCYGNGKFVGTTRTPSIEYSTDGINWTRNSALTIEDRDICYGAGRYVVASFEGSAVIVI